MPERGRSVLLGIALSSLGWGVLGYVQLRSEGADVRLRPVEELNQQLISGRVRPEAARRYVGQVVRVQRLRMVDLRGTRAGCEGGRHRDCDGASVSQALKEIGKAQVVTDGEAQDSERRLGASV